jgi:uncharacterized protein YndB with AHSA1/START domain
MRAHWLEYETDFTLPPERIFPYLAEHEHLPEVFGARIERVNDGDTERNGVGSRRRLWSVPGSPPFEETVTEFVPYERIVYKITKGGPMQDHVGIMLFTPTPSGGTHLDYRIRLASKIPGLALIVKAALTRNISKGMAGVDAKA